MAKPSRVRVSMCDILSVYVSQIETVEEWAFHSDSIGAIQLQTLSGFPGSSGSLP